LEQSLHAGQRALLLRDLESFEKETGVQGSLSEDLLESLRNWGPADEKLREAAFRVMHLCRVQSGLLRRAQRSLRAFSNLLAGPGSDYVNLVRPQQPGDIKNAFSQQEAD